MVGGWDFFVSYTQADRAWAEWIAWTLEESNHRVLIQAWDFVPGSNWIQSMQDGVSRATHTIAVLSEEYLRSVYGAAEWQAAWNQDPSGAERKLLTMRVEDCERPGLLSGVTGIDIFGIDEAKAKSRVLSAVEAALVGRAKPATKPGFPGSGRAMPHRVRFPAAGLPTVWNVPARNPNFVGRTSDLKQLEQGLAAGARVTVHSIHGMGGVGKTQLATEYADLKANLYDVVWWVKAEESATIPDQFAALADQLGLDTPSDPDLLRAHVHNALRSVDGWLLIFDNADQVETIRPWVPAAPLPKGTPGHVIVTTRRGGFRELGEVFEIDILDIDAAIALLVARAPGLDSSVAAKIAQALGRLPLALEQAAAYLDRSQMPAEEYLALLNTRSETMLAKGTKTIATVWTLSFDRLRAENPSAMQVMDICAYLAPDAIPLDLFTNHPDLLPPPLSDTAADPLAFNDAIAALVDYSLAKRTPSGLQIHRLVQATLRSRHTSSRDAS